MDCRRHSGSPIRVAVANGVYNSRWSAFSQPFLGQCVGGQLRV
ncbi:hypothetical protein [Kingella kingae]|nr:hypothetical protein [Kingella kingae]